MELSRRSRSGAVLAATLLVVACAPVPTGPATSSGSGPGQEIGDGRPRGTLRIAWGGEFPSLNHKLVSSGPARIQTVTPLFNAFLTDHASVLPKPMLARTIPSVENGDLVVNPDGTMVTVYRLRENATWHDGAPVTAHDLVFSHNVYADPEIPVNSRFGQDLMSRVEARDDHTLVIVWNRPYFRANHVDYRELFPMPRHLLEEKARTDKANFVGGPEWTSEYVGAGPFRVERWDPGSGIIARAHLGWFLGPPKVDRIEIRFIPDSHTVLANLLSGEVDAAVSPFVDVTAATTVRDRWVAAGDGDLKVWADKIVYYAFQFREVPGWQRALADLRVRQALMHATDREGLVEVMTGGLGSVADMWLFPTDPQYPEAERAVTKYPFDPNRAAALLSEAGWRRDQTGTGLRNAQGQSLRIQVQANADRAVERELSVIRDNWTTVGIDTEMLVVPVSRRDAEFEASFPGVSTSPRPPLMETFPFVTGQVPTPENRWLGGNRGSFSDPEVDRLHDQVLTLVEPRRWQETTVALNKRMSEVLGMGPLYYDPRIMMVKARVSGVEPTPDAPFRNIGEWRVHD